MKFDISHSIKDPTLNGSNGIFRVADRVQNQAGADTDNGAIHEFLSQHTKSPQTLRSYTKDCERLLIWSVLYIRKPISSMTRSDFTDYIEFMRDPDPDWCGKKTKKTSEDWRPFTGKMSEDAIRTSIASIKSLMNWLVNSNYITGNPLGLIGNRTKEITEYSKVERVLDEEMWSALLQVVENMPYKTDADIYHKERIRFILTVFVLLGARISEVANIKMCDFKNNAGGWFWYVNGKGNKEATVAMPQDMVDGLLRWRKYLKLTPLPQKDETTPAIPFVNKFNKPIFDKDGIKPRRINQILKEFFKMAAIELTNSNQEDKAEKIKLASAHWLRHTSITQKVEAGIDRRLVQLDARHTDARTTDRYSHEPEKLRSKEAQKHKIGWKDS